MASLNKVMIMGNLGQDPELRYTQNQIPVATFSVASSEKSKDQAGNVTEKVEWHRIVAWRKTAELVAKYLVKGKGVFVEGKLQTRKWQDASGADRYSTEIIASSVTFLPSGGGENAQQAQGNNQQAQGNNQQAQGNNGQHAAGGFPPKTYEPPSDLQPSLDDIPF